MKKYRSGEVNSLSLEARFRLKKNVPLREDEMKFSYNCKTNSRRLLNGRRLTLFSISRKSPSEQFLL